MAALAAWLSSLPLTGLVIYASERRLSGEHILAMGWLSPLLGNFAWFANIFFAYGILRLLSGGTPVVASALAVVLSLDTFRFAQYTLSAAGTTTPVYGYGWGAVLWFLSMSLLLAATGASRLEARGSAARPIPQERLRPLGFLLSIVVIGAAAYFAIHDRMVANAAETRRLEGIAFKRGKVCGTPDPVSGPPIQHLPGPLEIVVGADTLYANYPFLKIKSLLDWGIPAVRMGGADYSYEGPADERLLSSVPAAGVPTAVLHVRETYLKTIGARLVESDTNRVVFDQTWDREVHPVNTNIWCPDYHSFPKPDQQPRRLLVQALSLPAHGPGPAGVSQGSRPTNVIPGVIVEPTVAMQTRNAKPAPSPHATRNTNCPDDIGWDVGKLDSRLNTGFPFRVRGRAYYPDHRERYQATCDGDLAYIYDGTSRDGKYYLRIEKRTLPEFRRVWSGIVLVPGIAPKTRDGALKVKSVDKATGGVIIELDDRDTRNVYVVRAALFDKVQ